MDMNDMADNFADLQNMVHGTPYATEHTAWRVSWGDVLGVLARDPRSVGLTQEQLLEVLEASLTGIESGLGDWHVVVRVALDEALVSTEDDDSDECLSQEEALKSLANMEW